MNLDQTTARRAIRYLKRGAFPPDGIEYFTAGRERETRLLAGSLEEVKSGASRHCFIEANYGFGKSHMLRLVKSLALERGFAVSWVTINGQEHAFNHPSRYLHSLLSNLRIPTLPGRGLVELCSHWLHSSQRDDLLKWAAQSPWAFRSSIECLMSEGSEDKPAPQTWYLSMLEGRDLQHKSGCNYFPDFFQRLESTVGLCRAMGCSGIVFLFDELECVATHLKNVRSRMLSYQLLNTLVDGRRFPHSMFLFAATEDLGNKISCDLSDYTWYDTVYPEGYRFARKWHARELQMLQLKAVTKADNARLLRRLRDVHALAYIWRSDRRVSDAFVDQYVDIAARSGLSQRETVKSFIEILESAEQHSEFCPEQVFFGDKLAASSRSFTTTMAGSNEPVTQTPELIDCGACGQKLRFIPTVPSLQLRCPSCKHEFIAPRPSSD